MAKRRGNILVDTVDAVLTSHQFERTRHGWRLNTDETSLIVELQKSPWRREFYVNLGIIIRALSAARSARTKDCHILERLDDLVRKSRYADARMVIEDASVAIAPTGRLDMSKLELGAMQRILRTRLPIEKALDLDDTEIDDGDRSRILRETMETLGIPFLRKCDSIAGIRACLMNRSLVGAAIWKAVYDLCGVPFEG